MTRNVKCPFLSDGRCTIYVARPQSCRNYHATDVTGCQQSFEDPGNLDIDPDFAPRVLSGGVRTSRRSAMRMRDAGYDVNAYELNVALDAALSDPSARQRVRGAVAAVHRARGRRGSDGVRRSRRMTREPFASRVMRPDVRDQPSSGHAVTHGAPVGTRRECGVGLECRADLAWARAAGFQPCASCFARRRASAASSTSS